MSDDNTPAHGIQFGVNLANLNDSLARSGRPERVTEEHLRASGMVPMGGPYDAAVPSAAAPSAASLNHLNPVTGKPFRSAGRTHALAFLVQRYGFDPHDAYASPEVPRHLAAVMLVEITQMYLRQVEIVRALAVQVSTGLRGISEQVAQHQPAAVLDLSWYERLPHVVGYLRALEDQVRAHAEVYDAR